ncbi:hypothetical protein PUR33_03190, partial [Streptomyces sp. BE282]|nr:hypothetical protein [Streptomyces sp. BE282]
MSVRTPGAPAPGAARARATRTKGPESRRPGTAAITGAYVALADAVAWAQGKKIVKAGRKPLTDTVAAITYITPMMTEIAGYSASSVTWLLVLFGLGMVGGNLVG